MSTERDIIIERLEQKLAVRDKEFEKMQESLREAILTEMEKRFADKIKFRESGSEALRDAENRMERLEHRLIELNNAYDGVMKELLDQKSIIQELKGRKAVIIKEEPKPREEVKPFEKPKPKGEYIIAENYVPKEKKKQQAVIEAEDKPVRAEIKHEEKPFKKPDIKRSESIKEGVEIFELKKR